VNSSQVRNWRWPTAISVSDTGVGLPGEQADQIFGILYDQRQRTGMGCLSVARSLSRMAVVLWVTDNGGRGVTFHFTLPNRCRRTLTFRKRLKPALDYPVGGPVTLAANLYSRTVVAVRANLYVQSMKGFAATAVPEHLLKDAEVAACQGGNFIARNADRAR